MEIDPETFRQQYDELSDEALLSINRNDLIELAQQCYDAEVAHRGLQPEQASPDEAHEEEALVPIASFVLLEEANLGRALLRSADIPASLDNELTAKWTGAGGGLRLMVPTSFVKQAKEILESQVSEEDLVAQAEAAAPVDSPQDEDRD